jgi:hypothetical protein
LGSVSETKECKVEVTFAVCFALFFLLIHFLGLGEIRGVRDV